MKRALLCLSFAIPLLGLASSPPETMALLYSLFGLVWIFRSRLRRLYDRVSVSRSVKVVVLFLAAGMTTEVLAWSNNYLKAVEQPALFHPQLIPDLMIGLGFYGGWAFAWLVALQWFRFSVAEAFVVTGFQGIFFEQLGAVFLLMVAMFATTPVVSVVLGFYVFLVHGSIVAIALTPVLRENTVTGAGSTVRSEQSSHWARYPVVIVLMVALAFAGCAMVELTATLFGGLPEKKSIVEHPFW
ncbi:hypothetical protein [Aureliella helgolandensis]|uniref:Uncharacterized protein n=1 Tax=Aureliella helgolandensis TaxID=2527968 RepID=A0A518G9I6_9BACT|nr:hypothetical protein [Aureliella helgolandensis]QDV25255.1 hypothetical protein Q31a_35780 [Aureliella helgolandensis]